MAKKQRNPEKCRICGKMEVLTREHIIPQAAGGGEKTKLYTGDELIKVISRETRTDGEKPFGKIHQDGYYDYTLCSDCNSLLGSTYDSDFSAFYNSINHHVAKMVHGELGSIPDGKELDDYLMTKGVDIHLRKIKPMNIAKRILASFCSVDHPGLTTRNPEIRRAILDKHYKPDTKNLSIYMKLHVGSRSSFGTVVALRQEGSQYVPHAYAGIEMGLVAFYLTQGEEIFSSDCLNITNWLTDYDYDELEDMTMGLNFQKSLFLNIPSEAYE